MGTPKLLRTVEGPSSKEVGGRLNMGLVEKQTQAGPQQGSDAPEESLIFSSLGTQGLD